MIEKQRNNTVAKVFFFIANSGKIVGFVQCNRLNWLLAFQWFELLQHCLFRKRFERSCKVVVNVIANAKIVFCKSFHIKYFLFV